MIGGFMRKTEIMSDALVILGAAVLSAGAWLVAMPAGLICAGLSCCVIGWAVGRQ